MTDRALPSLGRLVAAFLAAPLVASLLVGAAFATVSGGDMGPWLPVAFGVSAVALLFAAPLTVVFGVPAWLLFRARVVRNRLAGAMAAGAAIALVPAAAVLIVGGGSGGVEGGPWLLAAMAAIGAAAGVVFWWIATGADRRRDPASR